MEQLSGYKTTILALVTVIIAAAALFGIDIPIDIQKEIAFVGLGVLNLALNVKRSWVKFKVD